MAPTTAPAAARRSVGDVVLDGLADVARAAARAAIRTWITLDIVDVHHVPTSGGCIIAATHESHADSVALGAAVTRRLSFLGAGDLQSTPVLGPFLPRLGLLPVERGAGDASAMDALAQLLRDGHALVIFPEGTRSRDGAVHRPRSGVARLAEATGVPVVPVGMDGTGRAWPVGQRPKLVPSGTAGVRFGAPMSPPGGGPRARRAWNDTLHEELVRLARRPRADDLAPVNGGDPIGGAA